MPEPTSLDFQNLTQALLELPGKMLSDDKLTKQTSKRSRITYETNIHDVENLTNMAQEFIKSWDENINIFNESIEEATELVLSSANAFDAIRKTALNTNLEKEILSPLTNMLTTLKKEGYNDNLKVLAQDTLKNFKHTAAKLSEAESTLRKNLVEGDVKGLEKSYKTLNEQLKKQKTNQQLLNSVSEVFDTEMKENYEKIEHSLESQVNSVEDLLELHKENTKLAEFNNKVEKERKNIERNKALLDDPAGFVEDKITGVIDKIKTQTQDKLGDKFSSGFAGGMAAGAVGLLIIVLTKMLKDKLTKLTDIISDLGEALKGMLAFSMALIDSVLSILNVILKPIKFIGDLITNLMKMLIKPLEVLGEMLGILFDAIVDKLFGRYFDLMKEVLEIERFRGAVTSEKIQRDLRTQRSGLNWDEVNNMALGMRMAIDNMLEIAPTMKGAADSIMKSANYFLSTTKMTADMAAQFSTSLTMISGIMHIDIQSLLQLYGGLHKFGLLKDANIMKSEFYAMTTYAESMGVSSAEFAQGMSEASKYITRMASTDLNTALDRMSSLVIEAKRFGWEISSLMSDQQQKLNLQNVFQTSANLMIAGVHLNPMSLYQAALQGPDALMNYYQDNVINKISSGMWGNTPLMTHIAGAMGMNIDQLREMGLKARGLEIIERDILQKSIRGLSGENLTAENLRAELLKNTEHLKGIDFDASRMAINQFADSFKIAEQRFIIMSDIMKEHDLDTSIGIEEFYGLSDADREKALDKMIYEIQKAGVLEEYEKGIAELGMSEVEQAQYNVALDQLEILTKIMDATVDLANWFVGGRIVNNFIDSLGESAPGYDNSGIKVEDTVYSAMGLPVNDALITADGEVINFHEDDNILAFKDINKLTDGKPHEVRVIVSVEDSVTGRVMDTIEDIQQFGSVLTQPIFTTLRKG